MSQRTDFPRKPMKRRSHMRKLPRDCVINMAEARRQIAQALQLHRSSLSSLSSSTTMSLVGPTGGCHVFGFDKPMFSGSQQLCYSILESMPLPQPIWSTTAPAVLGSPAVPTEEVEMFEWGDGQASYAWWLGFLRTLDVHSKQKYQNPENSMAVGMMSSMVLTQGQGGVDVGETLFLEASDQSSPTDEWLIIPISEDGEFIDGNCLGNDLAYN